MRLIIILLIIGITVQAVDIPFINLKGVEIHEDSPFTEGMEEYIEFKYPDQYTDLNCTANIYKPKTFSRIEVVYLNQSVTYLGDIVGVTYIGVYAWLKPSELRQGRYRISMNCEGQNISNTDLGHVQRDFYVETVEGGNWLKNRLIRFLPDWIPNGLDMMLGYVQKIFSPFEKILDFLVKIIIFLVFLLSFVSIFGLILIEAYLCILTYMKSDRSGIGLVLKYVEVHVNFAINTIYLTYDTSKVIVDVFVTTLIRILEFLKLWA